MAKSAFITGIAGQDGYFLSKFLLEKGYCVYGLVRNKSAVSRGNSVLFTEQEKAQIKLFFGDICDKKLITGLIKRYKFNEIYHLAGQTSIHPSLKNPNLAYRENIESVIHVLEAIRKHSLRSRFFLAASAELFGDAPLTSPQTEKTPFFPRNPYGFSKLAAVEAVKYYRENYRMFSSSGILYNHESEVRGTQFVTRKISIGVAHILAHRQQWIELGDVGAKRDWGYAGDYVEAMWKMLQQKKPDDYIIATGKLHSVGDFVNRAFSCAGIKIAWVKRGSVLLAKNVRTGEILVRAATPSIPGVKKKFLLVGNAAKAHRVLKWYPKVDFDQLVKKMVVADIKSLRG